MNQIDFEKIEKISEKNLRTINDMIDELEIAEVDRTMYKNLIRAIIRNEKMQSAVAMQEYFIYNHGVTINK